MAKKKSAPAASGIRKTSTVKKRPKSSTPEADKTGLDTPSPVPTVANTQRMVPPPLGVTVRMYRTGLGDCFLMAFPKGKASGGKPGDAFYLLLDCGVFFKTPEPDNVQRIKRIAADITKATGGQVEIAETDKGPVVTVKVGGQIDLLAITHEHWDHVSAFHPKQAQDIFAQNALKKLWMAWTENLSIPLARNLHDGRRAMRVALTNAFTKIQGMQTEAKKLGLDVPHSDGAELVGKALDFFGGEIDDPDAPPGPGMGAAKKSIQTEDAMVWLRDTYGKGKTEFLHPGDGPIELNGVADARVYVLGPPEDDTLIRRYNPSSATAKVYPKGMAAAAEAAFLVSVGIDPSRLESATDAELDEETRRISLPFDEIHQIKKDRVEKAVAAHKAREKPKEEDIASHPLFVEGYFDPKEDWRTIEAAWLESAGTFALQLDNATNNTSLAFALEIGLPGEGKVLLFPGDAQVGNWESWFGKVKIEGKEYGKDMVWKVGDKAVDATDLLRRTVLYKVGHHGSHNATLLDKGLKLMGRDDGTGEFVAMLPVDEFVAQVKAGYGQMPLKSLVKDLLIRTGGRLMRNDEDLPPNAEVPFPTLAGVEDAPARREGFGERVTELYIEYTVS
jgi:glyoxylase-like metal-dependent hydrolase (beta-lactamase superfamily II)